MPSPAVNRLAFGAGFWPAEEEPPRSTEAAKCSGSQERGHPLDVDRPRSKSGDRRGTKVMSTACPLCCRIRAINRKAQQANFDLYSYTESRLPFGWKMTER